MAESYEVKITLGDTMVEVTGAQEGVVEIVRALSELLTSGGGNNPDQEPPPIKDLAPALDARSLFDRKKPKSQNEAVVVASYYLKELAPMQDQSDTVDSTKVENVLRQAKFKLPKNLKSVLVNTQRAGYLDRVGLGEYRLNPVGWNLVEHTLGPE